MQQAAARLESQRRLEQLEAHLRAENPTLLEAVRGFRELDRVAQSMGLLQPDESFAHQVPWWPLVSLLGTFSAGKSSFVNWYLGYPLQRTGNQAVDDKFTVICHAADREPRTLPGSALDADPRFPFFRIGDEIEKVAPGEGAHADRFLQLKTCPSPKLRGKILIDSPGFDADAQRNSILRLTDHLVQLSDLVLVFFDARHPEPGAMRDTLEHLVTAVRRRPDSEKFLYILNQVDTTAREDNPEEVFAAWQRALAATGLTAGRFYSIYNPDRAVPIEDPEQRERYEHKRDAELGEILERIEQVEVGRAYRIVDALQRTCERLRDESLPILEDALGRWRKLVWTFDFVLLALLGGAFAMMLSRWGGEGLLERWRSFPSTDLGLGTTGMDLAKAGLLLLLLAFVHTRFRLLATGLVRGRLMTAPEDGAIRVRLGDAFLKSTRLPRSTLSTRPAGWSGAAERAVQGVLQGTTGLIQKLNDSFARPSGRVDEPAGRPADSTGPAGG
jgi:hypothetical protein